jgi:hypothetical protein
MTAERKARSSGALLPPSPPAENSSARQDQAVNQQRALGECPLLGRTGHAIYRYRSIRLYEYSPASSVLRGRQQRLLRCLLRRDRADV